MFLNDICAANGSKTKRRRVGRGIGSGLGKTCGRGHKGQHARAGGFHKVGFEGGQMPLQRRLPKVGFTSRARGDSYGLRLGELKNCAEGVVTLETLKAQGIISRKVKKVSIYDAGSLSGKFIVKGIRVTANAKAKIETAGGTVGG